jgi:hypothetical protein
MVRTASRVCRSRSKVYQGALSAVALDAVPPAFVAVPGVEVGREATS